MPKFRLSTAHHGRHVFAVAELPHCYGVKSTHIEKVIPILVGYFPVIEIQ